MNKRGQLNISFGTIFSILLIIIFIAFAFYAITKFLSLQSSVTIGQFTNNLQNDVNTVWNYAEATQPKIYNLPSSIKQICFVNNNQNDDLIFYSSGPVQSFNINNLNLTAMTQNGNLCFYNVNGKVNFTLEKNFGDTLVRITS